MKKLVIVYIVLIIAVILLAFVRFGGNLTSFLPIGSKAAAEVNSKKISLLVANSEEERIKGLSGKNDLGKDQGMIFVFEGKSKYPFWMKDMKFPLDIIYISDDTVVDIIENVPHQINNTPNLNHYSNDIDANYVLELNAGKVKELEIKEGTKIKLTDIK